MSSLKDGECPRCGSKEIVDNAYLAPRGSKTSREADVVRIERQLTETFFGPRRDNFTLKHYICGDCGYLESYVEKPDRLAAHSRKLKEATDQ